MADRNLLERELARVREEMEALRARPDASDRMSALMHREMHLYEQRERSPRKSGAPIWVDRKRLQLLKSTGWSNEAMSQDLGVPLAFLEAGAPESYGVTHTAPTVIPAAAMTVPDSEEEPGRRRPARRVMRARHRRDDTPDPAPTTRRRTPKSSAAPVTIRTVEEAGPEVVSEAPKARRRATRATKPANRQPSLPPFKTPQRAEPRHRHQPVNAARATLPPAAMKAPSQPSKSKPETTTKRRPAGQLLEDLINAVVAAEEEAGRPVASSEIRAKLQNSPNRQRVFAVLVQLEAMGCVSRTGKNRGTRWRVA